MKKISRQKHGSHFAGMVSLSASREEGTLVELSLKYGAHVNQIAEWQRKTLAGFYKL